MKVRKTTTPPKYGVFIIESIDLFKEKRGKLDGKALKTILDLCGIPNKYYYIRTALELENIIKEFRKSKFAFLHLACHGDEYAIELTYERMPFEKLERIIGGYLYRRRLFLSACKVACFDFAEYFIPKHHCYSVIGFPDDIDYDIAGVFWSSFYYLMNSLNELEKNEKDEKYINQRLMLSQLGRITELFQVKLNYYSIINNKNIRSFDHLREIKYDSGHKVLDNYQLTRFKNIHRLHEQQIN